jgi:hypothetical protein
MVLKDVKDKTITEPLTGRTLSSLNGNYSLFASDTATTTLDHALTLRKYWWKDRNDKDKGNKYHLSLTAKDARHLVANIYKENMLIATKTVRGKVKDGYFAIQSNKVLFFYVLLNGFGQSRVRVGRDAWGNLVLDAHYLIFATIGPIPVTGDRREEYGLRFSNKNASQ